MLNINDTKIIETMIKASKKKGKILHKTTEIKRLLLLLLLLLLILLLLLLLLLIIIIIIITLNKMKKNASY